MFVGSRKCIKYPNFDSEILSISHSDEIPIHVHEIDGHQMDYVSMEIPKSLHASTSPLLFNQLKRNHLICDLMISNISAEMFEPKIYKKQLLPQRTGTTLHFINIGNLELLHMTLANGGCYWRHLLYLDIHNSHGYIHI